MEPDLLGVHETIVAVAGPDRIMPLGTEDAYSALAEEHRVLCEFAKSVEAVAVEDRVLQVYSTALCRRTAGKTVWCPGSKWVQNFCSNLSTSPLGTWKMKKGLVTKCNRKRVFKPSLTLMRWS